MEHGLALMVRSRKDSPGPTETKIAFKNTETSLVMEGRHQKFGLKFYSLPYCSWSESRFSITIIPFMYSFVLMLAGFTEEEQMMVKQVKEVYTY